MPLTELLQILSQLAATLGIPAALFVYIAGKHRERREREYETYDSLGEKFHDFLELCIQYPRLDLYDVPLLKPRKLSSEEKIQQYALFDILVSLLERAYLMYRDQSSSFRKQQWRGWLRYIDAYAAHPTFRKLWRQRGTDYDERFMQYMSSIFTPSK